MRGRLSASERAVWLETSLAQNPPLTAQAQLIACDVINPANINVTFDSIGGLDDVKEALVRRRHRYSRRRRRPLTRAARPGHPAARAPGAVCSRQAAAANQGAQSGCGGRAT